jgi:hypothetical protein
MIALADQDEVNRMVREIKRPAAGGIESIN